MNIYDNYNLNKFCASNLSYEEKIDILKKQKEFINENASGLNSALLKLENGGFIDNMKNNKEKLVNAFKINLSLGLTATVASTLLASNIDLSKSESIYQLLLVCGVSGLGLLFDTLSLVNIIDINRYNKEIKNYEDYSYQRRLK